MGQNRTRTQVFTRIILAAQLAAAALFSVAISGCAEDTAESGGHVRVVKNQEKSPPIGGIPPDKEAEIQLLLQQRDQLTTRCYSDVLNDKHDRAFKGNVIVILTLQPDGHASDVKIIGGSMTDKEVTSCLVDKLKEFEYPQLPSAGSMQYVYRFEPAYCADLSASRFRRKFFAFLRAQHRGCLLRNRRDASSLEQLRELGFPPIV